MVPNVDDNILLHQSPSRVCVSYEADAEIVRYNSRTRVRISEILSLRHENQGFVRSANLSTTLGVNNTQMLETRHIEEGGLSHCQVGRPGVLCSSRFLVLGCVVSTYFVRMPIHLLLLPLLITHSNTASVLLYCRLRINLQSARLHSNEKTGECPGWSLLLVVQTSPPLCKINEEQYTTAHTIRSPNHESRYSGRREDTQENRRAL